MAILPFFGRPDLHGAIDEGERHRLELIIATARAFLAAIALLAMYLDPREPARYAEFAYDLVLLYDIHSLAVLLLLKVGPTRTARLGPWLHAIDLAWAVSITFLTEGPNSSFFALFVFLLLAAAYRWGFRETLLTGLVAAFLFFLETVAVSLGMIPAILELDSVIMRCAYFLLATFLLAYLSEQAKGLRASATIINRLTSRVDVREGLAANMRVAFEEILRLSGSREAVVALKETSAGRVVLWEAAIDPSLDPSPGAATVQVTDLSPEERKRYLASVPPKISAWEATKAHARSKRIEYVGLDENGKHVGKVRISLPEAFSARDWTTLLCLMVSSNDWSGRLFLIDPTVRPSGERRLQFLRGVVAHMTPVLHNVYLLRRLRLRVGALERARVARELHDSVLQSLTSIEMQLDVARRDATLAPRPAGELAHIQNLLRQEILSIRDLMEQLRPRVTDSRHLADRILNLADRMRRENGIDVRCRTEIGPVDVSPELCHELTRIVQEALINVRKHSGASSAEVTLRIDDWAWRLYVKDNGRGLGFAATLSHAQQVARRVGPRTIRERVEAVGGKLQLHSGPDGLHLEMIGRLKKPWILTPSA